MKYSSYYFLAVVTANLGFTYIPLIPIPGGEMFAPMSLLVGLVFVLRDFAQKELGHRVLFVMTAGLLASYLLADPYVAYASAAAFAISEFADWLVYTVTKKPLKDRILISSVVSTPIDSATFMMIVGFFSWYGLAIMVASKMIAAVFVWKWMGGKNEN